MSLEARSKKRAQKANVQKVVLGTVAAAGILATAALAPNALKAMRQLGIMPHGRQKEVITNSRDRLVRRGLLRYEGNTLRLTPKGEQTLREFELAEYSIGRPRRWDKKWRVLIFDIPEPRRKLRDRVRQTLMAAGFVRLQDSVWIFPYPCEDLVVLLKADFKIGKDLLYLIVEELEYDAPMRRRFGLPAD